MNKLFALLVALLTLGMVSCEKESVKGAGEIITQTRTGDAFTSIEADGDLKVFITYGPQLQVSVTGYDNLVPLFETRVSNNTLKAGYKGGTNIKNNNIELHITMPVLTGLKTNGSITTQIAGNFAYTSAMSFKVEGSGNTVMESGSTGSLTVESSGSGTYNLLGLQAAEADIKIAGSGEVKTAVVTKLKAKIEGSGRIYYQGNPALNIDVNGSGKLVKL